MEAVTYSSYLALDEILGAQRPRSEEPDEMLFIVIHQVYELWFKQMLHELDRLADHLGTGSTTRCLDTLRRILTILKVAVAQVDVLETMTPRQFTGFRGRLDAASGFQSAQFRQIEAVLGRRAPSMLAPYPEGGAERTAIAARMAAPSVFDAYCRLLAERGYPVPKAVLERDVTQPYGGSQAVEEALAAVYADDGPEAQVAERLVDLDEGLQEWRYRHVKMVQRTIGDKGGTGGSSGAAYLQGTLFAPVFPDLWAVRRRL
ncbi:MAG TPA: tryptophan 2,3-dioxygenase family protein [Acidimicrobiales bacterium]|nr:tryptophan 2,3-dioxygenase family protein [Acidimicrobiales bacterium]